MCVAAVAFLFAGHAVAGPCDEAERGTYLSNVCWLVEEFSEQTPTFLQPEIASVDETECTVTLTEPYLGTAGGMIRFNRGDPKSLSVEQIGTKWLCWHLNGEGVSEGPLTELPQNLAVMAMSLAQNAGKRREDRVTVCGSLNRVDGFRVIRAVSNLYAKHCTGKEFRVLEESGHDDRNETYARRYDGRECSG